MKQKFYVFQLSEPIHYRKPDDRPTSLYNAKERVQIGRKVYGVGLKKVKILIHISCALQ